MTASKNVFNNLDAILSQLGAKIGIYQIKNYIFICIPIIYSAMFTLSYVFTARNLDYRCYIPECDSLNPSYNAPWLKNAIPFTQDNAPRRCDRFSPAGTNNVSNRLCSEKLFVNSSVERCDSFVFETEDITILNEFNLMCDENVWKLTLVGTINNIGQFVCLPISGFVSDRFGRRFLMLGGLLISAIVGFIRSFSPNYYWFMFLEFLDPAIGSGAYSSGFILGVEQVSPDKRVLSGSVVSSAYAVGEAIVGIVAWYTPNWRWFLRYLYLPGIFIIALFWLTPESLRWMLSKGKKDEAKEVLRRAAKLNKINISEESLNGLDYAGPLSEEQSYPLRDIFKSKRLLMRLMNCSFCWITCAFVFYGLSLNSVAVAGNLYLNFIFVALIEIPGYFTTYLVLDRFGRRYSLCGSLLLSGFACLSFIFIPEEVTWMKLTAFLVGKFGITISFTVLYVFTTELFPTPLRHSLLGTCSMFGRTGSMIAPQTPLLAELMKILPLLLFGGMSVTAGLLILACPETLNTKLPDTIQEAENIGVDLKKEKEIPSV